METKKVMDLSQWDKLIENIINKSPGLRFEELAKALQKIGYESAQPRSGSSHYTFRKKGCTPITIQTYAAEKGLY